LIDKFTLADSVLRQPAELPSRLVHPQLSPQPVDYTVV